MDLKTVERRHREDIIIRWISYLASLALFLVVVGCALHLSQIKQTESSSVAPASVGGTDPRSPADVGQVEVSQLRADMFRLQQENAKLRAALIEAQQKLALRPSKKKKTSTATVRSSPATKSASAKKPAKSRAKPAKKVAQAKKKKKPKIIQVSFDGPK
jgi:hypothetical protein